MTVAPSRCSWASDEEPMQRYHDTVWGVPQRDPSVLFEFLTLEGAQAGLSWRTILHKREGYRVAFAGFDVGRIAAFTHSDVERLMQDTSIVRNRSKITSTIGNARAWLQLDDPVSFLWDFVDGSPIQRSVATMSDVPSTSDVSDRLSRELKKRGFRFVGSTICYAYMQACGLVNNHIVPCFRRDECAALG